MLWMVSCGVMVRLIVCWRWCLIGAMVYLITVVHVVRRSDCIWATTMTAAPVR
jgi:hypothetical protein